MSEVAIRGNLQIGRVNIEGKDYLTVCVDKNGGPMIYEFPTGQKQRSSSVCHVRTWRGATLASVCG